MSILGKKLGCIRWWGSKSRDMESVKYLFIVFTPMSTPTEMVVLARISGMSWIELFEKYSY